MSAVFKKPVKKIRLRRKGSSSDDDGDEIKNSSDPAKAKAISFISFKNSSCSIPGLDTETDVGTEAKNVVDKKKVEKSQTFTKTASVISFDLNEEGDGEVFKVKKSSHSKKVAKLLKKEMQKEKEETKEPHNSQATASGTLAKDSSESLNDVKDVPNGSSPHSIGSDFEFEDNEEVEEGSAFKNILQSGIIPDAATIHMIRKKRQLARETGDFIPVDDTEQVENTKSRLIREDDNDISDDEEEGRVEFTLSGRDEELRQMQQTILAAREASDGSDHEWEEQQIRKGVSMTLQQQQDQNGAESYGDFLSAQRSYISTGFTMGNVPPDHTNNLTMKRTISVADLPQMSVELMRKRLTERLDELKTVHNGHFQEQQTMASRLESNQDQTGDFSSKTSQLECQYRFYQETKCYIRDVIDCLNEKVPKINFLERSFLKLWQKRSEKVVQRRQQDLKDESQDCMGPNRTANVDQNMDEQKARRAAEREARRARRKRKREGSGFNKNHNEGMSTDDEANPSEVALYQSEKERLTTEAGRLFEDVEDEFCDIACIQKHFEAWKKEQPESYHEAYIALCLPKLLTPYVKLKLVTWNPAEESLDVESQGWFKALIFYGYESADSLHKSNDDLKLLPSIIEKVLVPKVTGIVENFWDPLASQQTVRLTKLVKNFCQNYPTVSSDSKNTKALVKAVVERIRKCLDNDVFMPLFSKQLLEARGPAWAFFHRQLWCCIKLLGNISMWHGVLSDEALRLLALDSLLNRYILLGLQNCSIAEIIIRVKTIMTFLPSQWFQSSSSENSVPQMAHLFRLLYQMCLNMDQAANASGRELEVKQARDSAKQVIKLLVSMHGMDYALKLASHFSIKIGVI